LLWCIRLLTAYELGWLHHHGGQLTADRQKHLPLDLPAVLRLHSGLRRWRGHPRGWA